MRNAIAVLLTTLLAFSLAACLGSGGGDSGQNANGTVARITLTANATGPLVADGVSTIPLTVRAVTTGEVSPSGLRIEFATNRGILSSDFALTDTNGVADVTLIAPAQPSVATITASYRSLRDVINLEFQEMIPDVARIILSANATEPFVADGVSTIPLNVQVVTTGETSPAGLQIDFSTNLGTLSSDFALTDTNGLAVVTLIAPGQAGVVTITASYRSLRDVINLEFEEENPEPAAILNFMVSPPTVTPQSSATISAQVVGANNTPSSGIPTTLRLTENQSGSSFTSDTQFSDAGGWVFYTYVAGPQPGVDSFTIRTDTGVGAGPIGVLVAADNSTVTALSLSAPGNSPSLTADGSSSLLLEAAVFDAVGAPVVGVPVTFTVSSGSLVNAQVATDAAGEARTSLVAPTTTGVATVTAAAGAVTNSLLVTYTPGPAASLSGLTATPTRPAPGESVTISVRVLDGFGNPVLGENITLSLEQNLSGTSFTSATGATDIAGRVTFTDYTAGPLAGEDILRAFTSTGVASSPLTITVDPAAGGATVGAITLSAEEDTITADGVSSTPVSAIVVDTSGNAAPNTGVSFTSTLGIVQPDNATTSSSGVVQTSLRAGTNTGVARVTARAGSVTNALNVTFAAGPPSRFASFSTAPAIVGVSETSTLQATVFDDFNNPVPDTPVTFVLTVNGSGSATTSLTAVTNIAGQASAVYTAGPLVGRDFVQARTGNGVVSATRPITVTQNAGQISSIALELGSGAPASLTADGLSSTALEATLTDNTGSPLTGVTVNFATTLGRLSSSSAVTNSSGVARTSLIAGTVAGQASVTATSGSVTDNITVPINSGAAQYMNLDFEDTSEVSLPADGVSSLAIVASVFDGAGNPVQGQQISFFSNNFLLASVVPVSATTDDEGQVRVSVIAGSGTGTVRITAQAVATSGSVLTDSVYIPVQ